MRFNSEMMAGVIYGTITQPAGNRPLSDAIIMLNPLRAVQRSDENGCYRFENIHQGNYEVLFCFDNTLVQKNKITVGDTALCVDFKLIPGDLDQNGKIDLIDAAMYAQRMGSTSSGDVLDLNEDQIISEDDLDLWYGLSWQRNGYWYSYKILDDAEHENPNAVFPPQGRWQAVHDIGSSFTVPASSSTIYPSASGYYSDLSYDFQYMLGSVAQYPYALIRLIFGANENINFGTRKYEGFSVALQGEDQPLIVSLKSAVTSDDWSEYYVRVHSVGRNWQAFTFNFREQFRQPGWGGRENIENVLRTLQAIQFKADDSLKDQTFSLRIDGLCLIEKLYNPASGNVSGNLVCNGSPLPAAIVTLASVEKTYEMLSEIDGVFEFPNVEVGNYNLTTFRPGYHCDTLDVNINADQQVSFDNLELQQEIPQPKPASKGPVRVAGHDLQVDFDGDGIYSSFFIKGVGYSPVPIGSLGELIYPERVYSRDMPLLQAMNCNTIRTWGKANSLLLDKAQLHDIKVLAGFWVSTTADFYNPTERLAILDEFRRYVSEFKDHPAILCWSVGNEQNYVNGDNWAWYSLVEDLAVIAYEIEGDRYHPVATPNGDRFRIGFTDFLARDVDLPYLDIWGMNIYKSDREGFSPTFLIYSAFSSKPLWISEYGIDAYDNQNHREYEIEQAEYAKNRVVEMINSPVCIGSTLMAYSDEWWKAGDPNSHDLGGYPTDAHPDGFSNEEWWGTARVGRSQTRHGELFRTIMFKRPSLANDVTRCIKVASCNF